MLTKKEYKYIGINLFILIFLGMIFGAVASAGWMFVNDGNFVIAGLSLFVLILLKIPMFLMINFIASTIKREVRREI